MNTKMGGGGLCGMPRGKRQNVCDEWWRSSRSKTHLLLGSRSAYSTPTAWRKFTFVTSSKKWVTNGQSNGVGAPLSSLFPLFSLPFRKSKTEIELKLKWGKKRTTKWKSVRLYVVSRNALWIYHLMGRGRDQLWAWQRDVRMWWPACHTNKVRNEREQWKSICLERNVF